MFTYAHTHNTQWNFSSREVFEQHDGIASFVLVVVNLYSNYYSSACKPTDRCSTILPMSGEVLYEI